MSNWELDISTGEVLDGSSGICKVYGATVHNHEDNVGECMMNARLITAAPKMYSLLSKLWLAGMLDSFMIDEAEQLLAEIDGGEGDVELQSQSD